MSSRSLSTNDRPLMSSWPPKYVQSVSYGRLQHPPSSSSSSSSLGLSPPYFGEDHRLLWLHGAMRRVKTHFQVFYVTLRHWMKPNKNDVKHEKIEWRTDRWSSRWFRGWVHPLARCTAVRPRGLGALLAEVLDVTIPGCWSGQWVTTSDFAKRYRNECTCRMRVPRQMTVTSACAWRIDASKSTKGASKLRRDLINAEIANLRDLLPLPPSTRQRLSQLQLMALVCVFLRKANYFQQGMASLPTSLNLQALSLSLLTRLEVASEFSLLSLQVFIWKSSCCKIHFVTSEVIYDIYCREFLEVLWCNEKTSWNANSHLVNILFFIF